MNKICTVKMQNTTSGHNKQWQCTVYDNGLVITEWGPINGWSRLKSFKNRTRLDGESFAVKKISEKEEKGYVVVDTINYETT